MLQSLSYKRFSVASVNWEETAWETAFLITFYWNGGNRSMWQLLVLRALTSTAFVGPSILQALHTTQHTCVLRKLLVTQVIYRKVCNGWYLLLDSLTFMLLDFYEYKDRKWPYQIWLTCAHSLGSSTSLVKRGPCLVWHTVLV